MATRHVALQYVTGFRCIGPACEEQCCGGWTVVIDQVHHDKLQALMTSLGEGPRFDQAMAPPPRERRSLTFATINQSEDGNCAFLASDRTCEIHGRYGEAYLSDGCATYPRLVSRAGTRIEIAASVSCPEVARLMLLAADACDLVPCDDTLQGRGAVSQSVAAEGAEPYAAALDLIRGTLFGLLTRREYPMRSRLFFLVIFGERLAPFLVKDTTIADPARLVDEIRSIEDPETLAEIDAGLQAADGDSDQAVALVMQLLSARLEHRASQRFRPLVLAMMKGLAAAGAGVTLDGDDLAGAKVSPVDLARHLDTERGGREALIGERLEQYLENYCRNWVMHDWYVYAPSVALHVQRLLFKVATLRLLLLAHPGLTAAAAAGPDAVDRLAVEVFYSLARTMEHSDAAIHKSIAARVGDVPPLAVALALLRI